MKLDPNKTSDPTLARSLIRTVGRNSVEDLARDGAGGGFPRLTYYRDTVKFYRHHKKAILALLEQTAADLGEDPLAMVASFGCLKSQGLTSLEVARAIDGRGEESTVTQVQNALAWFAAEEMARQLCPDV